MVMSFQSSRFLIVVHKVVIACFVVCNTLFLEAFMRNGNDLCFVTVFLNIEMVMSLSKLCFVQTLLTSNIFERNGNEFRFLTVFPKKEMVMSSFEKKW